MEGSNRFLRRLWSISYAQREAVARGRAPTGRAGPGQDLRREVYGLLKQADYDYQRIQYNTVVSACMKMLNAIDDAKLPDGRTPTPPAPRRWASCCACCIRWCRTSPGICGGTWATPRAGRPARRPWPHVDEAALIADEIELMLQVNGKLRGSIRVAAQAARERIAR